MKRWDELCFLFAEGNEQRSPSLLFSPEWLSGRGIAVSKRGCQRSQGHSPCSLAAPAWKVPSQMVHSSMSGACGTACISWSTCLVLVNVLVTTPNPPQPLTPKFFGLGAYLVYLCVPRGWQIPSIDMCWMKETSFIICGNWAMDGHPSTFYFATNLSQNVIAFPQQIMCLIGRFFVFVFIAHTYSCVSAIINVSRKRNL